MLWLHFRQGSLVYKKSLCSVVCVILISVRRSKEAFRKIAIFNTSQAMLGVYQIAFVLGTNTAKATPDRPFGDEMHDLMPSWKLNTLNQIGFRDIPTLLWTAEWISAPHKISSPACRVFSCETIFAPRVFPLPTIPKKINLAPKAFPLKIGRRAQFTREKPRERGWGKIERLLIV